MRPALLALIPLTLAACTSGSDAPAEITADASLTDGGTTCPEANWLTVADYAEEGLPAADDNFLTANAARKGVTTNESGLQYKVVQAGLADGVTPGLNQMTTVHYHGYFPDGEVFDSSYDRDETIDFPPSGVIAGWTEALTGMKVCEARTLYVPYDLAYGERGRGGIPPKATLLFNVQVLGVQ